MPERILIVKPSSLGDIIHALPVLAGLRRAWPEALIDWILATEYADLLSGHPMINEAILIRKGEWKRISRLPATVSDFSGLRRGLGERRYDLVLDLQGLFRSGLITWFTRSARRVGFSDSREMSGLFYTEKVRVGGIMHAVEKNLLFLDHLGIPLEKEPEFPLPGADKVPGLPDSYYIVSPGGRWVTKRWPPEHFREVISGLHRALEDGPVPVIAGGEVDRGIAGEIVKGLDFRVIDLTGRTTIRQLITLIRNARFMITNDSGPMHLASAAGTFVFAVFGPTSPDKTGPYGDRKVILQAGVECSPCFRKRCRSLRCMHELSPHKVIKIIADGYKKF
jgi:lipopolysaccharide heptosyltransferase I